MSLTARWVIHVEIVLYQESEFLMKLRFWCQCCYCFGASTSVFGIFHIFQLWFWKKACVNAFDMSFLSKGSIQLRNYCNTFAIFLPLLRLVFVCRSDKVWPWVGGEESKLGVLPGSREQQQACRTPLQTARWPNRSAQPDFQEWIKTINFPHCVSEEMESISQVPLGMGGYLLFVNVFYCSGCRLHHLNTVDSPI